MKNPITRTRLGALAAATVVVTSAVPSALAASYVWQTAGTNNNWSLTGTDTNWFIDADTVLSPWADGNDAVFAGAAGETLALVGTVAPTTTTINDNGNWVMSGGGVLGGTGTLVKNGTGTLTLSNTTGNVFSGGATINGGTLALGTGGTGANTSTVSALGTGTTTINSGTLKLWIQNSTAFTIANNLSINGGTIQNEDGNHTLSGAVALGASGATLRSKWNGKNLTLTGVISGSSGVTVARSADNGGSTDSNVILTGSNTYTGGTTVNSAQLQLGNNIATDKGGTGIIRGTLTANSNVVLGFSNALGYTAGQKLDIFNINGATVNHTANGDNGWGVTYNMTGGTLQTTGTGRFSFGANTVVNTLASANAATIGGNVWMRDGNTNNTILINTADGTAPYDLLLNANISIGSGGGNVGITKLGPGAMLVSGTNVHTGPTNVNEGLLALGPAGTLSVSPVVVNNSGTFRSDAAGKTFPSLTANDGAILGLVAAPSATTNVTGALTLTDGATIAISPILSTSTPVGTYDLITAGSITGTGTPVASFSGLFGPSRATGSVAVNGNKLQLTLTSTGTSLVWNNASAGGAATGTWDTNISANFNNGGSNDVFKAFDSVTFNDSVAATTPKTVNVSGLVAPGQITVNNTTGNNYTLTAASLGSGQIAGSASLIKTGTGTVTLGSNLSYAATSGEISVGGGIVDLGGKTLFAHSKLTLTGGGSLNTGTLPVSGTVDFQQGSVSSVLAGAGTFAKTTSGTVTLTGNNTFSGGGTITAGTLQIGSGGTSGLSGTGPIAISPGATLAFFRSDNPMPAIPNAISGGGNLVFNGTGTSLQSSYTLTGNNSGFSGTLQASNSRVGIDNVNDVGTATLTTGTNGQLWVTAGTHANAFNISGNGWTETNGPFGAIRISGATISGPVTLSGDARITTQSGSGTISGNIGESGGTRNLEIGIVSSGSSSNLTLSGANTYTGTTTLSTATLNLRGSLASSAVNVGAGSTVSGNGTIAGTLNFASGATNLGVNLGLPGNLTVAGAVTLGGTTTVTFAPSPGTALSGNATILSYGSITGTAANLALANPTNFRQAVFNVGANAITLNIGSKALKWTGTGGLTWDIATTQNWSDTVPAASAFFQGDQVSFDDTAGAANATVTIAAALTPASVTVNNSSAVPYTFTGAGSIGGGASLVKQGNGSLLLTVAAPYLGGTVVNGGSVIVDGNNAVNRQAAGGLITVNNTGIFEVRGVNALPTAASSTSVTVNAGGTLRVTSGASAATSAAIGSHCHFNNITLNGGTVDFTYAGTGTAYNGESFQLNGTVTVGGSLPSTIQSGDLIANQGIALAGNRSFVVPDVTSSAASDLLISAEVENSDTNNGVLTKTGTGTLELTAANSYSAGTNVSQGTLLVSNGAVGSATGTGGVIVSAGATLGGNGGATGAVTAAGTLAPAGLLRTGNLELTGNYACEIDGFTTDIIEVTGDLNLSGATLNLAQAGAGITETSNVIGTWTGTRTGAFANATGLPAGYSVQYDDINKLILVAVGGPSGYAGWLAGYPGLSDTSAAGDPDKDGIPNLLEYILGGNPGVNNSSIKPTQQLVGSNIEFSFKRSDDSEADTVQTVQWSTNMTTWTDIAVNPTPAVNVTITENGSAPDDVKVTIPRGSNTKIFVRLKATN